MKTLYLVTMYNHRQNVNIKMLVSAVDVDSAKYMALQNAEGSRIVDAMFICKTTENVYKEI